MSKKWIILSLSFLIAGCGGHQVASREPRAFKAERAMTTWNTFQKRIHMKHTQFKQYEGDMSALYQLIKDYFKGEEGSELLLEFHDLMVIGEENEKGVMTIDPWNIKIYVFFKQVDLRTIRVDCEVDYYGGYKDKAEPICGNVFSEIAKTASEVKG